MKKKEEMLDGNEVSEMVVDEIVDADENDVVKETAEIDLPEPIIKSSTEKPELPKLNFDEIKKDAEKYVELYKDMVLTEDNIDSFIATKNKFVRMRTTLEKARKDWVDKHIKPVKTYVDTKTKELVSILGVAEDNFKEQLKEYDQRRIDELNEIFEEYIQMARKKYEIPEDVKTPVELKKSFYNKGAKEKETREDIFEQVAEMKKAFVAKQADYTLITTMCNQYDMTPEPYLTQYDLGADASSVCLNITETHNKQLEKEKEAEKASSAPNDFEVVAEQKESRKVKTNDKEVTKTICIELTVTKKQVEKLNKFLKKECIKVKML